MKLTVDGTVATFFHGCERWLASFEALLSRGAGQPGGLQRSGTLQEAFESMVYFLDDARQRLLDEIRPSLDATHEALSRVEEELGLPPGTPCPSTTRDRSREVIARIADPWLARIAQGIERASTARDKARVVQKIGQDALASMNDARSALLRAIASDAWAWDARCSAITAAMQGREPGPRSSAQGSKSREKRVQAYLAMARPALSASVAAAGKCLQSGDAGGYIQHASRAASTATDIALAIVQHEPPSRNGSEIPLDERLATLATLTALDGLPATADIAAFSALRDQASRAGTAVDPAALPKASAFLDALLHALECFTLGTAAENPAPARQDA